MAAPEPSGGGSFLTRRIGPLPAWGWIVALAVGYYLYKRFAGGSSPASSSVPAGAEPTASVTLPGGYSYSGPASGAQAFQQAVSPGQGAAGSSPGSGSGSPGTYTALPNAYAAQALLSAGQPVYTQVTGTNTYVPISQPGGYGGEWYAGSQPLAPGSTTTGTSGLYSTAPGA